MKLIKIDLALVGTMIVLDQEKLNWQDVSTQVDEISLATNALMGC